MINLFLNNFQGYKLLAPQQYCLQKFRDINMFFGYLSYKSTLEA